MYVHCVATDRTVPGLFALAPSKTACSWMQPTTYNWLHVCTTVGLVERLSMLLAGHQYNVQMASGYKRGSFGGSILAVVIVDAIHTRYAYQACILHCSFLGVVVRHNVGSGTIRYALCICTGAILLTLNYCYVAATTFFENAVVIVCNPNNCTYARQKIRKYVIISDIT
jgi:hypothetical protein